MTSNKKKVLDKFAAQVQELLKDRLLAIYHFGSTAKGIGSQESDIDVLIVFTQIEEKDVLEMVSETCFRIACETGEVIEPVLMSEQEYKEGIGNSPFLWEAVKKGKAIFTQVSGTEWELDFSDYLGLSSEYLGYAKDALKEGKLRLAIDTAYNACELMVKALIISTETALASSHGGIVGQFGKLFVVTGLVDKEIGKNLHMALELRAKARYKASAKIEREDAEFVLSLAKRVYEIAKEKLEKR